MLFGWLCTFFGLALGTAATECPFGTTDFSNDNPEFPVSSMLRYMVQYSYAQQSLLDDDVESCWMLRPNLQDQQSVKSFLEQGQIVYAIDTQNRLKLPACRQTLLVPVWKYPTTQLPLYSIPDYLEPILVRCKFFFKIMNQNMPIALPNTDQNLKRNAKATRAMNLAQIKGLPLFNVPT